MKLTVPDMTDCARGAAFLGTGGGGDPYIGRLLAEQSIREFGMPEVVEPNEVPDEATIVTAAMVGAPTVMVEKIPSGADIVLSINKVEEAIGKKADFVIPIEIGGCNSMLPIVAAARMGLPLINGDGMGRAFPELQMVTFNIYGVSSTPCSLVDEHLNTVVYNTSDAKTLEQLVRPVCTEMGLSALFSSYPMTGSQMKRSAVHGTMKLALDIGRAIKEGRQTRDPIGALLGSLRATEYYNHCKVVFSGKVVDLRRETTKGFSVGHCRIAAISEPNEFAEIIFQNENLVIERDGKPLAMVPDLICVVDSETGEPITTEGLRYGQRVHVIATSCAPVMRTPEALDVFGPHCFGLELDFAPIETLHSDV